MRICTLFGVIFILSQVGIKFEVEQGSTAAVYHGKSVFSVAPCPSLTDPLILYQQDMSNGQRGE